MRTKVLLCTAAVLAGGAAPAQAAFPGANGLIAFSSFPVDGGAPDIWTMKPNGRDQRNLTANSPAANDSARWSADGRRLVFISDRDGDAEVFTMHADGTHITQITFNDTDDVTPSWSPDGRRVAFARYLDDGYGLDIWSANAGGHGEHRLTRAVGDDIEPAYSPDGRTIAFASERDPTTEQLDVFTMDASGAHPRPVVSGPNDEEWPNWSPDGRRLAFISERADPFTTWDVYVVQREGGPVTRLTTDEGGHPAWSPDGRKIVFGSNRTGNSELFTMRPDGSHQTQRTNRPDTHDGLADWQPLPSWERGEDDED
jgi:TolB protein